MLRRGREVSSVLTVSALLSDLITARESQCRPPPERKALKHLLRTHAVSQPSFVRLNCFHPLTPAFSTMISSRGSSASALAAKALTLAKLARSSGHTSTALALMDEATPFAARRVSRAAAPFSKDRTARISLAGASRARWMAVWSCGAEEKVSERGRELKQGGTYAESRVGACYDDDAAVERRVDGLVHLTKKLFIEDSSRHLEL